MKTHCRVVAIFALAAVFGAAVTAEPAAVPAGQGDRTKIGQRMPDGTVFAGISRETHHPLYTTPADAPDHFPWGDATAYCAGLDTGGHKDWRVPSLDELDILYEDRNAGALKGTFDESGSYPTGRYWSSSPVSNGDLWTRRFSDGHQINGYPYDYSALRCVR